MTTIVERELQARPANGGTETARASNEHRQFLLGAGLAVALVAIGFGRGFLPGASPQPRSRAPLVLVHAAVFTSWIVLFAVQTSLVASGRGRLHRRLGVAGAVLAAVMLVLGIAVAVRAARTGFAPIPGVDPLRFLVIPIGDIVVFASFVGAGVYWRRSPDVHKRLMWLATVNLLFAAITRLPGVPRHPVAIAGSFLGVLAFAPIYERIASGRFHRVSAWGSVATFLSIPARDAIAATGVWHTFALWLVRG
jgi:hypothetical protein